MMVAEMMRFMAQARWFRAAWGGIKVILACVAPVVSAAAAEPPVMRVGIEAQAEPLSFVGPEGRTTGFSADFIAAIAAEMKFEIQPVVAPWSELFGRFRAGEVDVVVSLAYTPERDVYIDYAVPHLTMQGRVFVRTGEDSISRPEDLARVRVGVQRDSYSHEYLRARGWDKNPVYVQDFTEGLLALESGRCDAVAAVGMVGAHVIRKQGLRRVEMSEISLPGYSFNLHMGVHAGDAARLALLNEGLARIRANGQYDRIHERWIGPLEPRHLRFADFKPFLAYTAAAALAVAAAFWWQRRLLRRLAEQTARLGASEERLRLVLEGSDDGFWDWNLATNHIERSERWAGMLGYAREAIPPTLEGGLHLVHPDDRLGFETWRARLDRNFAERVDIEYRMRAKNGEWRWILDRGKVVERAPDGTPLRMAGTHTDITERKRTEAALLESQALLKRSAQLLEQSQAAARVGGWETDLHTGRIYWTEETFRIHETTPEEFTPSREGVYRFYVPESRARLQAAAELAIRTGVPYSLDLELITARQNRRYVHCTGVAERENGRAVKLYGSFRDITGERQAERDREELRLKMLEAQKLESLGVLAGGIAHDFNNLLTVILANASFIRDSTGPHEQRLAHIESAAQRAADLCRQMLAYAGKAGFIAGPVDLGALVRDTAELIHVSLSKKASLTLDFPAALPHVAGDASQLRQVVMNLVINASEALGDHPGRISLSARTERPAPGGPGVLHSFDLPAGDCLCLEVADTGHGMDPATLQRIFEPFFTTKFTGRGLGLPAVLGIVRTHRGALRVESTPGRGTTFRVFLPVAATRAAPTVASARTADNTGSGRLLIADDEAAVLETTDLLLRHFGYETVLAVDGEDAVRKFRSSPESFNAVLMDLTMPGLDGADALREIRAIRPGVPALVMSGFSEADVLHRLHGLGDVTIMRKPFSRQTLLEYIVKLSPGSTVL